MVVNVYNRVTLYIENLQRKTQGSKTRANMLQGVRTNELIDADEKRQGRCGRPTLMGCMSCNVI